MTRDAMYHHGTSHAHDPRTGGARSTPGSSTHDERTTLGALGLCGVLLAAVVAASYPVLAVVLTTAVSTFLVTTHARRDGLTRSERDSTTARTHGRTVPP